MVPEIALTTDFAVIIVTAAVVGLLARQTGQPTIVAYILAGLVLGPAALGMVTPSALTETMAELGLAFLLFLLGIKMRLDEIRDVLASIVKIALPQMVLVGAAGLGIALALGFPLWDAVIIGLAVMYSSTAVVIKMLTDKDEANALHGKLDVGVLLVQDIVVVVLLAVLAAGRPDSAVTVATTLAVVLALVAAIGVAAVAAAKYLLPALFRQIANNKDVFFLVALSWAFLFVFVSDELDLSIEMGAFLAGVALAQLPYSKELQDRVNPLTDLFVLVFFASIGLQLEASDLFAFWPEALVAAAVLLVVKFLVFATLIRWQGFDIETTFLGSLNMIQVSEFGLVVGTVAVAGGFIDEQVLGFLSLVALCTIAVSVYVIAYNHALFERVEPFLQRWETETDRVSGTKEYTDHAVVIGYDEVTRPTLELLAGQFDDVVVIDRNVDHVELLSEAGYDVVYGDFRHSKIRKEAGLKAADFVLSSSVEPAVNKALLAEVGEEATVFVEAEYDGDARDLYEAGAHCVIVSPQLAGERLAAYVDAYFDDDEAFERAIETDNRLLRSDDLLPKTPDRVGGLDD